MAINDSLYWRLMTIYGVGASLGALYVDSQAGLVLVAFCYGALCVMAIGRFGRVLDEWQRATQVRTGAHARDGRTIPRADGGKRGEIPGQRGGPPRGSGHDRHAA